MKCVREKETLCGKGNTYIDSTVYVESKKAKLVETEKRGGCQGLGVGETGR